jgi:hypothetical protein
MAKHKFYFTDDAGRYNGYDRKTLWIDIPGRRLCIAHQMSIPLREIMAVEVKPLPCASKTMHLAIHVCGPSVGGGKPTTLLLIHRNFFCMTNVQAMVAFANEIAPLIKANTPVTDDAVLKVPDAEPGRLQAQYALNISVAIGYYRKLWYLFDPSKTIVAKALMLMTLGGIINVFGVLLVAVPFDNYRMSRSLIVAGWPRRRALFPAVHADDVR